MKTAWIEAILAVGREDRFEYGQLFACVCARMTRATNPAVAAARG
jgi:hypothetical protein